jgi:phosphate transport system protein
MLRMRDRFGWFRPVGGSMKGHTIQSYQDELDALDNRIVRMAEIVEKMLANAIEALEKLDRTLAEDTVMTDTLVDNADRELEDEAVSMVARRQPVAEDLRQIVCAMRIAGDLERIGDLSKNLAKRTLAIADEEPPMPLVVGLQNMSELALKQLHDVIGAYTSRDAEKALEIWRSDTKIDAMHNALFRELLTYMMEDPRKIGSTTHLLFAAKNIERVGDHTTNIAESVHYLVRGSNIAEARPKDDKTSTSLVTE